MGKRELLLVLAFLGIGTVVYHLTAPPGDPRKPGFSLSGLVAHVETMVKGERAEATIVRRARIEAPAAGEPVRLTDYRGRVTMLAEARSDIEAELTAVVFGVDDAAAQARGQDVTLDLEPEGDQVEVVLKQSEHVQRRPRFELTLRVPLEQRVTLGLRSGEAEVRGVAWLSLEEGRGKLTILDTRRIDGSFQGDISAQRIDSAKLEVRRGEVRFDVVSGTLALDAEHSDLTLSKIGGAVTLTTKNLDCNLDEVDGPITIESEHTKLDIRNPRAAVTVTATNSEILLAMTDAVPVTMTSSDETIDVRLPKPGVRLDVETTDGEIRTTDARFAVQKQERAQTLQSKTEGGGPLIKLRNENGHIVLR